MFNGFYGDLGLVFYGVFKCFGTCVCIMGDLLRGRTCFQVVLRVRIRFQVVLRVRIHFQVVLRVRIRFQVVLSSG